MHANNNCRRIIGANTELNQQQQLLGYCKCKLIDWSELQAAECCSSNAKKSINL